MSFPKVTLGRDGLGAAATPDDYASWLAFVTDRIDEACGFIVDVEPSNPRDVQENRIEGADDEQRETITEALRVLWELWCGGRDHAEPPTDKHFVPPAPPTLPDMAAVEMPIRRGEATATLVAAMANLTAAVLTVERVAMACARALDERAAR